jgi:hypothetical protein
VRLLRWRRRRRSRPRGRRLHLMERASTWKGGGRGGWVAASAGAGGVQPGGRGSGGEACTPQHSLFSRCPSAGARAGSSGGAVEHPKHPRPHAKRELQRRAAAPRQRPRGRAHPAGAPAAAGPSSPPARQAPSSSWA